MFCNLKWNHRQPRRPVRWSSIWRWPGHPPSCPAGKVVGKIKAALICLKTQQQHRFYLRPFSIKVDAAFCIWDQGSKWKWPPVHSCQGLLCFYTLQFDQRLGTSRCTSLFQRTKSGNRLTRCCRFPAQLWHCSRPTCHYPSWSQSLTPAHLTMVDYYNGNNDNNLYPGHQCIAMDNHPWMSVKSGPNTSSLIWPKVCSRAMCVARQRWFLIRKFSINSETEQFDLVIWMI